MSVNKRNSEGYFDPTAYEALAIAKALTAEGIPTPAGKSKWGTTTVASILTNEKYKGAALLQKKFTVDFLEKKMKVNEGEVPQYYIEESHQPIIDPDEFDRVQAEFARRKGLGHRYSGGSIFASRIVCGDCGTFYGSKVWHSNSKYRRTIWQCNGKFKGAEKCRTPHLLEEDIKARFLVAFNKLLGSRNTLLDDCRLMQSHLTDCSAIDAELEALCQEIEVVTELTQRCIQENARSAQSQEEYTTRYNGYVARYDTAKAKLDTLQQKKDKRLAEAEAIGGFMFALSDHFMIIRTLSSKWGMGSDLSFLSTVSYELAKLRSLQFRRLRSFANFNIVFYF